MPNTRSRKSLDCMKVAKRTLSSARNCYWRSGTKYKTRNPKQETGKQMGSESASIRVVCYVWNVNAIGNDQYQFVHTPRIGSTFSSLDRVSLNPSLSSFRASSFSRKPCGVPSFVNPHFSVLLFRMFGPSEVHTVITC